MPTSLIRCFVVASMGVAMLVASNVRAETPTAKSRIDFARDVRPILSNHCWSCHGPDEATRQAKRRLDRRDTAIAKSESGQFAIVPGQPATSELVARIQSRDDDLVMPPPSAKKPLTAAQQETLRRWIEQGAEFAQHWAFVPPQFAVPPSDGTNAPPKGGTTNNPIDAFILARLAAERLTPSPPPLAEPNVPDDQDITQSDDTLPDEATIKELHFLAPFLCWIRLLSPSRVSASRLRKSVWEASWRAVANRHARTHSAGLPEVAAHPASTTRLQ